MTASFGNGVHRFLEDGELVDSRLVAFPEDDAFSLLQVLRKGRLAILASDHRDRLLPGL